MGRSMIGFHRMQPWDGVSWRSTCCVVVAFLLNGLLVPFTALAVSLGYDPVAAALVAVAAALTLVAILMRVHGPRSTALRLVATGANAALLAQAAVAWRYLAVRNLSDLIPAWDVALIGGIAALNILLLLASRRIHVSREVAICFNCGYEVGASWMRSCPECGWRRENGTADAR